MKPRQHQRDEEASYEQIENRAQHGVWPIEDLTDRCQSAKQRRRRGRVAQGVPDEFSLAQLGEHEPPQLWKKRQYPSAVCGCATRQAGVCLALVPSAVIDLAREIGDPVSDPAPPALELFAVTVSYSGKAALQRVSLSVPEASCVAIVGESGSGKTTLLRLVNGLVAPDQGSVRVRGAAVAAENAIKLRRRIGYVPQDGGLMPHWRVLRNAGLVPRLQGRADADAAAVAALQLVGLDPHEFGARWPHELSGGQRQRVALARALAAQPELVLLDEAFSALDAISRADVQDAFVQVRTQTQVTVLLVTHDLGEALRLSDRIAVLRNGQIEQIAAPLELVQAPATPYVRALIERARASWPAELRA